MTDKHQSKPAGLPENVYLYENEEQPEALLEEFSKNNMIERL